MPPERPKGRPQSLWGSAVQLLPEDGYLLLLFASGLAIGQSSTEPIQRLPGGAPPGRHSLGIPRAPGRQSGHARGGWYLL